jgi:hypothetical protein
MNLNQQQRRMLQVLAVSTAVVMAIVLGTISWQKDVDHSFIYCLLRFLFVAVFAAGTGAVAGLIALRFFCKK